ncbi:MAG: outer-membrane lipoprotein carrier protein LolA [Duncaniella sp.]|nr:outer-membrane lipoprotein carrier protein LolA [Duncaniella sp.]
MTTFIRYILLILALTVGSSASAVDSGVSVLDKTVETINKAKSITADYSAAADGHVQRGVLTVCGDRFKLISPSLACWYDGQTQWTYSDVVQEVNITSPTPEELQQVNPFAIIRAFRSNYVPSLVSVKGNIATVSLKSKNMRSDIRAALISVNTLTNFPEKIELTLINGQKISITVSRVKTGGLLNADSFRFNSRLLPGVPVVDLR